MQRLSTKYQPAKSLPIIPSDNYAQIRLFITLAADNYTLTTPRAVHPASRALENPAPAGPKALAHEPYSHLQSP
jgi:hypothetical protein